MPTTFKIIIGLVFISSILVFSTNSFATEWCNPDAAGTDYGSPCSPNGQKDVCGADGKKTECKNNTWHAQGGCCLQPSQPPIASPAPGCPGPGPNNCAIYECPDGCIDLGNGKPECRTFVGYANCNSLTKNSVSDCGQIDYLYGPKGDYCGVLSGSQCRNGTNSCNPVQPSATKKPTRTPTKKPKRTPTPTSIPQVSCDQVTVTKVAGSSGNTIRAGDTVNFTAYGNSPIIRIRSFRFKLTLDKAILLDQTVPAQKSGNQYSATSGNFKIEVIGDYEITAKIKT